MWVTQLEGLGRGEVLFDVGTWHMLLRLGSAYCAVTQSLSRLVKLVARTLMVSFTVISFRQNPHYVLRYFTCSTYLNIDLSVPKATYIVMMCTHTHTYSPHPLILTHTPHVYTHTHTHTHHTQTGLAGLWGPDLQPSHQAAHRCTWRLLSKVSLLLWEAQRRGNKHHMHATCTSASVHPCSSQPLPSTISL